MKKQPIFLLLGALLLTGIILAAFIYFRQSQTPPENSAFKQRLQELPPLPPEPAIVTTYTGEVRSIDADQGILRLATLWGEKIVEFDQSVFVQTATQMSPAQAATPPPQILDKENSFQPIAVVTIGSLQTGNLIAVSSLTNISGLSKFKVDSITIIK